MPGHNLSPIVSATTLRVLNAHIPRAHVSAGMRQTGSGNTKKRNCRQPQGVHAAKFGQTTVLCAMNGPDHKSQSCCLDLIDDVLVFNVSTSRPTPSPEMRETRRVSYGKLNEVAQTRSTNGMFQRVSESFNTQLGRLVMTRLRARCSG